MAAVASKASLAWTFQRTASGSGRGVAATPVCKGLPRNSGQSAATAAPQARATRGIPITRVLLMRNDQNGAAASRVVNRPDTPVQLPNNSASRQAVEEREAGSARNARGPTANEHSN